MSRVFPWFLLFDAWITALLKVSLPLARGRTVLCDRCVLDTLVDLMAGLANAHFDERLPGRLFFSLLPPSGLVVVLDLDTAICCRRSPELAGDRTHALRRALYLDLAQRHGLPVISGQQAPPVVTRQVLDLLASAGSDPSKAALALGNAQQHTRGGP
jgi:thymidylate kinase